MFKLVLFDFDGTLFDTYDAIEHCATLTFATCAPEYTPPRALLRKLISKGAALGEAFSVLYPADCKDFNADHWTTTYRAHYAEHGQALSKPYPRVREVLDALKEANILVAIVSNKAVPTIKIGLERWGLLGDFHDALIIGDQMPGARRKPDARSYAELLLPALKAVHGQDFEVRPEEVLMVGDTVSDILYAKNVGMPVVWCRYGQGTHEECEQLEPEFTIDRLEEVMGVALGEKDV